MGFTDWVVDRSFRDDPAAGRVVVFTGQRRGRGFLVRSNTEESKVRSFLKMFLFAQMAIQGLGTFLTVSWVANFTYPSDHSLRDKMVRMSLFYIILYGVLVIVPMVFLQQNYKKGFASFFPPEDEIQVSSSSNRLPWAAVAVILAFALLASITILALVWRK